jgi:FMN phosphatase YigB (HAD superfamily)
MLKITKCKPEETIMIGDKLNDDVIPPRSIGMNAILFKNYEQLKLDLEKFGVCI